MLFYAEFGAHLPSLKTPAQNGASSSFGGNNIKEKKKKNLYNNFFHSRVLMDERTNSDSQEKQTNFIYPWGN